MSEFQELGEKIDNLAETMAGLAPKIEHADRELYGNGQPGLVKQMARVENTQRLALKVLGAIGVTALGLLSGILLTLW